MPQGSARVGAAATASRPAATSSLGVFMIASIKDEIRIS
jgi:hypothetical protein